MFNSELESVLKNGHIYIGAVQGKSMLPMLHETVDHVKIVPLSTLPKKNDIVLYRRVNGQYVLHRVVSVKNNMYVMRGDHQYKNEYPIAPYMCIGILQGYWKNAGTKKEKYISVSSFYHRTYSFLWRVSYPIRYGIRYLHAVFSALFHKIIRRKHS